MRELNGRPDYGGVFKELARTMGIALGMVVLGVLAYSLWAYPGYDPIPFSSVEWRTAGPEVRGYMADDLVSSRKLEGMNASAVFGLLGEPDNGGLVINPNDGFDLGPTLEEIRASYPVLADADFDFVSYGIGFRGARADSGLVLAFSYTLEIHFADGQVSKVIIHD